MLEDQVIYQVLVAVWRRMWLVALAAIAVGVVAFGLALKVPKRYQASVELLPSSSAMGGAAGSVGSAAAGLGGVAALIGMNLPSGDEGKTEALATLQSRALAQRFIEQNNLLPVLFSGEWNAAESRWRENDERKWPSLWSGTGLFGARILEVRQDNRTGLVTLEITWSDPKAAASWANGVVQMTNDVLREKAITESERRLKYLREQAEQTAVLKVRDSIYNLVEGEINRQMLARGSDEFALRVIDPAVTPESPSWPNPMLWAIAGLFVGASAAVGGIVLRFIWAGRRPRLVG